MKKRIVSLVMVLLYVLGVVGGILFDVLDGGFVVGVGIAAVAWMAWPKFVEYRDNLIEEDWRWK